MERVYRLHILALPRLEILPSYSRGETSWLSGVAQGIASQRGVGFWGAQGEVMDCSIIRSSRPVVLRKLYFGLEMSSSGPAVWEQVHALEREFGVALIEPHGRGCRLTDLCRFLAERADPNLRSSARRIIFLPSATGSANGSLPPCSPRGLPGRGTGSGQGTGSPTGSTRRVGCRHREILWCS